MNNEKDNDFDSSSNSTPPTEKPFKKMFKEYTYETRDAWLKKYYDITEVELQTCYDTENSFWGKILTIEDLVRFKLDPGRLQVYRI